jgi:hypothetical protein
VACDATRVGTEAVPMFSFRTTARSNPAIGLAVGFSITSPEDDVTPGAATFDDDGVEPELERSEADGATGATTRGPGNKDSNPRPKARRFSGAAVLSLTTSPTFSATFAISVSPGCISPLQRTFLRVPSCPLWLSSTYRPNRSESLPAKRIQVEGPRIHQGHLNHEKVSTKLALRPGNRCRTQQQMLPAKRATFSWRSSRNLSALSGLRFAPQCFVFKSAYIDDHLYRRASI